MAKILFIVPVYNASNYIKRCIDSILAQTYKDIELILVDDGSKDGSELICDNYMERDDCVKVLHQINQGVAIARNVGLDYAINYKNPEYISFVDSDDQLEENFVEKFICLCEEYSIDMYFSGYKSVRGKESVYSTKMINPYYCKNEDITEKQLMEFLNKGYTTNAYAKIFSKDIIKKIDFIII